MLRFQIAMLVACGTDPVPKSVDLGIPPRKQWENDGGYCGETSIQSIGLHFGAWISQQRVRELAGGEVLLGVNERRVLDALHFAYTTFDNAGAQPQAESFFSWVEGNIATGAPVIFAAYVSDGDVDPDYDHIMPAVGVRSANPDVAIYDPDDVLIYNNNFEGRIERAVGGLAATRATCTVDTIGGGCVPADVDYGIAIDGFVDTAHATLPISLAIATNSEPNVSIGVPASQLAATVTASGLTPGRDYALLRFDDVATVPTDATAAQYLVSPGAMRHDFTADGNTWTYSDSFTSSGVAYFRVVPR